MYNFPNDFLESVKDRIISSFSDINDDKLFTKNCISDPLEFTVVFDDNLCILVNNAVFSLLCNFFNSDNSVFNLSISLVFLTLIFNSSLQNRLIVFVQSS